MVRWEAAISRGRDGCGFQDTPRATVKHPVDPAGAGVLAEAVQSAFGAGAFLGGESGVLKILGQRLMNFAARGRIEIRRH